MNQKVVRLGLITGVVSFAITTGAGADGGPQHRAKQTPPIKLGTSAAARLTPAPGTAVAAPSARWSFTTASPTS